MFLHKKGDKRDLKNWTNISLLDMDYKIIAKLIADRMNGGTGKLVEVQQMCAVSRRMITESLVCFRYCLRDCMEWKKVVMVLGLDFEKEYRMILCLPCWRGWVCQSR